MGNGQTGRHPRFDLRRFHAWQIGSDAVRRWVEFADCDDDRNWSMATSVYLPCAAERSRKGMTVEVAANLAHVRRKEGT